MNVNFRHIALCFSLAMFFNIQSANAQGWTFPYPTEGTPCSSCAPPGWVMDAGSPDISSLDNWIGYQHYEAGGIAGPVPEPVPGATSFMTAMAYGGGEQTSTSFVLAEPQMLTVYFGGFGTSWTGGGPVGAEPGFTENLLVNGASVSVPIPWDGEWHPVTYTLVAGMNTIVFSPPIMDDGNRHAVSIYIPADQPVDCTEDLLTTVSDTEICLGEELTLEAESVSGGTITWTMDVENGVPFTPEDAGIITYTATSDHDDDCPFSVDITIHELPVVFAGEDVTVCDGDEVTLGGTGGGVGIEYDWDGGVIDDEAFVPPGTTVYTLTGTNPEGCEGTDDVLVTVLDLPPVDAGEDVTICFGEELTLTAVGAGPDGEYVWTGGVENGVPFAADVSTVYTVTGTDDNGCVNTDDVAVTVNELPEIEAGEDQEICEGEGVVVNGSGAGVDGTYAWDGGVVDGEEFFPVVTTVYTVTGTDDHGCENTDDLTVTVNPSPPVNAGADIAVCDGDPVTLTGSGAGADGEYVWTGGISDGVSFVPTETTTYTVTGTDETGCFRSDDVVVTVNPLPEVMFSADELIGCTPFRVQFSSPSPGLIYDWNFGDGTNGSTAGPVHTYESAGVYDVTLTITSAEGCTSTLTYFDYITVYPKPVAAFSITNHEVDQGTSSATFNNSSLFSTSYEWTFGDGSGISNETNPEHTYPTAGGTEYTVLLVASNEIGCVDSLEKKVKMEGLTLYYIPNTFTPDGDNFNEQFLPVFTSGIDIYDFHMVIFNRWGEMVFETYDPSFGWNGAYGDTGLVQDGTYIWQVEFGVTSSDARETHQGHVTVIK